MRDSVFSYIKKTYKTSPEYPWKKYPGYAVFRHADTDKWFALQAEVPGNKLGLDNDDPVEVINLKIDDMILRDILLEQDGIMPAYHMNKLHWVTVLLDGTVKKEQIFSLIDISFLATASAKKKQKLRPPKAWIVPANPKYYDIEQAFDESDEIDWKQGAGIKTGDTVFLYVGSPVSAILYKCRVTETDIPYDYQDKNLTIKALMRIKLQKRYDPETFTFEVLKKDFGIYAVRGPRSVPDHLQKILK